MKLIIDIPEETYKKCKWKNNGVVGLEWWERAIANGIPIPDNDCDSCKKAWTDKCERAECYENNYKHWTPYQKGGK